MREIKFRGKRAGIDEWIYGYVRQAGHENIEKANGQYIKTVKYYQIQDDKYHSQFIDENTLGQYTGLKDKNGKEIYEGDIVSEKGHYVNSDKLVYQKIQWKENYSCWLRGEYQRLTPKNIKNYSIEVIGNIYDNPELLAEKE